MIFVKYPIINLERKWYEMESWLAPNCI